MLHEVIALYHIHFLFDFLLDGKIALPVALLDILPLKPVLLSDVDRISLLFGVCSLPLFHTQEVHFVKPHFSHFDPA